MDPDPGDPKTCGSGSGTLFEGTDSIQLYFLRQVSDSEGVPDLPRPAADVAGEYGEQAPGAGRVANKKPTQKTHLKNPLKLFFLVFWGGFFGFFLIFIFYENNTNFSL
jgi:hypothetical protein